MKGILILSHSLNHTKQLLLAEPPQLAQKLLTQQPLSNPKLQSTHLSPNIQQKYQKSLIINFLLPKNQALWNKILDITIQNLHIIALPFHTSHLMNIFTFPEAPVKHHTPHSNNNNNNNNTKKGSNKKFLNPPTPPPAAPRKYSQKKQQEFLKMFTCAFILQSDPNNTKEWQLQYETSFYQEILTKLTNILAHEQRLCGYMRIISDQLMVMKNVQELKNDHDNFVCAIDVEEFVNNIKLLYRSFVEKVPYKITFRQNSTLVFNVKQMQAQLPTPTYQHSSKHFKDLCDKNPFLKDSLSKFNSKTSLLQTATQLHCDYNSLHNYALQLIKWKVARVIYPITNESRFKIIVEQQKMKSVQSSFYQKFKSQINQILHLISQEFKLHQIYKEVVHKYEDRNKFIQAIQWMVQMNVITQQLPFIFPRIPSMYDLKQLQNKIKQQYKSYLVEQWVGSKKQIQQSLVVQNKNLANMLQLKQFDIFEKLATQKIENLQIKDKSDGNLYIQDYIEYFKKEREQIGMVLSIIYPFFNGEYNVYDVSFIFDLNQTIIQQLLQKLSTLFVVLYI